MGGTELTNWSSLNKTRLHLEERECVWIWFMVRCV